MRNKKVILTALIAGVITLGIVGTSTANAYFGRSNQNDFAQKFADKFGLNQTEVQTFFDDIHQQMHEQHQAEMQTRHEERLSELVSEGQISEEQKQLILQKQAEQQANREDNLEEWQNLTREERRTQMEEHREEMQSWAAANGIDMSLIGPFGPAGEMGKGMGHRGGPGNWNN